MSVRPAAPPFRRSVRFGGLYAGVPVFILAAVMPWRVMLSVKCSTAGSAQRPRHLPSAHMHESVEECPGGDYRCLGAEFHAPHRCHAHGFALLHEQFAGFVLPHIESGRVVDYLAPCPDELAAVALCPRTHTAGPLPWLSIRNCIAVSSVTIPMCPPSASISRTICPLAIPPTAGVAAHLRRLVHIHRYEAGPGTHGGCGSSRFASCVSSADNDDVVK